MRFLAAVRASCTRRCAGAYGDEGPQLAAHVEKMTAALAAWDGEIRDAESQLRRA